MSIKEDTVPASPTEARVLWLVSVVDVNRLFRGVRGVHWVVLGVYMLFMGVNRLFLTSGGASSFVGFLLLHPLPPFLLPSFLHNTIRHGEFGVLSRGVK